MNRFRQVNSQQRLLIEGIRPEEENIYFLNGFELKRPNIISRRNTKYQVVQVRSAAPPTAVGEQSLENVSYIDELGTTVGTGIIQESYPIELFPSDSFIVSETTFPTAEISLSLEPTVVSQPVPAELPLTYDSTCVSQSISTPIVTPIVSSSSLTSEYRLPTVNNTNASATFEMQICENGFSDGSDGIPYHILGENEASFYLTSVPAEEDLNSTREVAPIEPREPEPDAAPQNQMRIETQPDGSFVLYLEDLPTSEPIDLGPDAQIIQTDAFPVVPNQPFELPSVANDGRTESFMLVPIDDKGNTVLVPAPSSTKHAPAKTQTVKIKRPLKNSFLDTSGTGSVRSAEPILEGEKPKPFRYELPDPEDEDEENSTEAYREDNFMTMSVSTLVPHLLMSPTEAEAHIPDESQEETRDSEALRMKDAEEEKSNWTEDLVPLSQPESSKSSIPVSKTSQRGVEETLKGAFRCTYCGKETRLKVGIVNHVNRFHKAEDGGLNDNVERTKPAVASPSVPSNPDVTVERSSVNETESSTEVTPSPSPVTDAFEYSVVKEALRLNGVEIRESCSIAENMSTRIETSSIEPDKPTEDSPVRPPSQRKRKRFPDPTDENHSKVNPIGMEPILNNSEGVRNTRRTRARAALKLCKKTEMTMKTRSSSSGRCLRNSR